RADNGDSARPRAWEPSDDPALERARDARDETAAELRAERGVTGNIPRVVVGAHDDEGTIVVVGCSGGGTCAEVDAKNLLADLGVDRPHFTEPLVPRITS